MIRRQTPCDVTGALTLSSGSSEIKVVADSTTFTISLPVESFKARHVRSKIRESKLGLKLLHKLLVEMDVDAKFEFAGRTVATLGKGTRPGFASHALGLAPMEVRLAPLVSAWINRNA